ncbi:hypothetical protein M6B22_05040 [Jatrophihabitans cynanchi]|jgi:hypothetical protein|uniref:Uncharacterized protein n=1 Tax=Jatrophihabitans cynanchi TaxID=2944128 RepID=A0ABY7JZW5_9ACTN|nr:hypothetical protein [Jatrophihabitans sp. SB3-54]WAX58135.1 hypothetical protein M6B22_05040 [Jatrophihabitans sp. SB3-54]
MIAAWFRQGGPAVPRDSESLGVDDDGTFSLWRAVGAVAAGFFSGRLAEAERDALAEAAEAVQRAGDLSVPLVPDAAAETISAGVRRADLSADADVDPPWRDLVGRLRRLADDGLRAPVAAIALEVSADGQAARLVHRGTDPVGVDLGTLALTATLWRGWYQPAGTWTAPPPVPGPVTAGPGWAFALPFAHGLELGADRTLHVAVDVQLTVNGTAMAAGLRHAPEPPARPA